MDRDDRPENWGAWADQIRAKLTYLLDVEQHAATFVSRFEAKDLRERHGGRVVLAASRYPGAKADAQALRDAVKPMFDKRFQDTSHMFEEFVRSEQGRFIGTVKTETENALLWTPMWIDRERGMVDAGMYERLRAFRETTLHMTDKFEESTARVREQLGRLPEGIAGPAMAKFETLIAEVKAQQKDAAAQTAAALDEAAATTTPDAVKRDLDRSRLLALVKAG